MSTSPNEYLRLPDGGLIPRRDAAEFRWRRIMGGWYVHGPPGFEGRIMPVRLQNGDVADIRLVRWIQQMRVYEPGRIDNKCKDKRCRRQAEPRRTHCNLHIKTTVP